MMLSYNVWIDLAVLGVVVLVFAVAWWCNERRHRLEEQRQLNELFEKREAADRRIRRGLWKIDDRRNHD